MSQSPTVVLVPGAWSVAAHYHKLSQALGNRSFEVHVPELPTNNAARPPNSSFEDDVAAVRKIVEPLVAAGRDVCLLMHSYGGAVGTTAIEGLTRRDSAAEGRSGGVVALVYMCAYLLKKGECLWNIVERAGLADVIASFLDVDGDGTWALKDPVVSMYADLEATDQEEQKTLVRRHNMAGVHGQTTFEAWRDVPTTYIRTTQDACMLPPYQDICVANAEEACVSLNIKILEGGHSPYVKVPEQIVDLVVEALARK